MGKGCLKLRGSLTDERCEPAQTSTYDSTMASDSRISSAPSSNRSSYPPNTGISRSVNSATTDSSLYDDRKQADRAAVMQALTDPTVAKLMERAARACKVKRDNNGTNGYASHVCLQEGFTNPNTVAMAECRLEIEGLPNNPSVER
ncbi:hypothetical protein DM02DRAFT_437153 [Periconia macrospinosa]|uniref:Uncharacterized protein n=1 Tax=Periconia macrospinosa TaxID=97972 RepID=A0A2V1CXV9_9PLEO|nr:hypothetical protein DM02DRAFT_437153 [Periconia macrospinosa]